MSRRPDVKTACDAALTYRYDGSFEGFLCCVFESYTAHEMPTAIIGPNVSEGSLFDVKEISTDEEHAARVARSIPARISPAADDLLRHAFLTCLPEKELVMLRFLRQGYRYGARFLSFAGNNEVWRLTEAVKRLLHEAHLLKGFIRFSDQKGVLVTTIGPKNFVLPFLSHHFAARFPAPPDEEERKFRALWRSFYDTIEIRPRHNEKCRMTLLPKRYWKYMTEFTKDEPPELLKIESNA